MPGSVLVACLRRLFAVSFLLVVFALLETKRLKKCQWKKANEHEGLIAERDETLVLHVVPSFLSLSRLGPAPYLLLLLSFCLMDTMKPSWAEETKLRSKRDDQEDQNRKKERRGRGLPIVGSIISGPITAACELWKSALCYDALEY